MRDARTCPRPGDKKVYGDGDYVTAVRVDRETGAVRVQDPDAPVSELWELGLWAEDAEGDVTWINGGAL